MKTNYDFPYPFLDFTNKSIRCVNTKFEDAELIISIDLGEYPFNDKIDIILEVESSQTFYRKLFVLKQQQSDVKIELVLLGLKVDYTILLVAKQDGNIEINSQTEFYEFGDCIGIVEKDSISFTQEEGVAGLIKIAPTGNDTIAYDLTSDWITVELPKETYEKFYPWQKDDSTIPFALASLGNSCIQFAIMKTLNNESLKEKKWWETITKLLADKGYNIDDLEEEQVPGATNKILGNCIQEMVKAATPYVDDEDTSTLA